MDYVAGITLGLDLTLRDLQTELKNKGKPWELAKAFDGAAPLGDFKPYLGQDLQAIEFECHVNGKLRQHGNTNAMLYPVAQQIHNLSQTWSLEPGDVIRSEEHTSELQSLMRTSYAVFCLKTK